MWLHVNPRTSSSTKKKFLPKPPRQTVSPRRKSQDDVRNTPDQIPPCHAASILRSLIGSSEGKAVSQTVPASAAVESLASTLLKAVWSAITLGFAIQIAIMVVTQTWPDQKLIPEVGQKVSWSVLVCSAMAIGNSIARARPMLMGVIGLLAAPVAFSVARVIQRGLSAGGSSGAAIPGPLELSLAKGLEYALFGVLIASAAKSGRARNYLLSGLTLAIVFTTYIETRLIYGNASPPPASMLVSRGINEFIFPIGCAFVLWFTTEIGAKLTALQSQQEKAAPFQTPPAVLTSPRLESASPKSPSSPSACTPGSSPGRAPATRRRCRAPRAC